MIRAKSQPSLNVERPVQEGEINSDKSQPSPTEKMSAEGREMSSDGSRPSSSEKTPVEERKIQPSPTEKSSVEGGEMSCNDSQFSLPEKKSIEGGGLSCENRQPSATVEMPIENEEKPVRELLIPQDQLCEKCRKLGKRLNESSLANGVGDASDVASDCIKLNSETTTEESKNVERRLKTGEGSAKDEDRSYSAEDCENSNPVYGATVNVAEAVSDTRKLVENEEVRILTLQLRNANEENEKLQKHIKKLNEVIRRLNQPALPYEVTGGRVGDASDMAFESKFKELSIVGYSHMLDNYCRFFEQLEKVWARYERQREEIKTLNGKNNNLDNEIDELVFQYINYNNKSMTERPKNEERTWRTGEEIAEDGDRKNSAEDDENANQGGTRETVNVAEPVKGTGELVVNEGPAREDLSRQLRLPNLMSTFCELQNLLNMVALADDVGGAGDLARGSNSSHATKKSPSHYIILRRSIEIYCQMEKQLNSLRATCEGQTKGIKTLNDKNKTLVNEKIELERFLMKLWGEDINEGHQNMVRKLQPGEDGREDEDRRDGENSNQDGGMIVNGAEPVNSTSTGRNVLKEPDELAGYVDPFNCQVCCGSSVVWFIFFWIGLRLCFQRFTKDWQHTLDKVTGTNSEIGKCSLSLKYFSKAGLLEKEAVYETVVDSPEAIDSALCVARNKIKGQTHPAVLAISYKKNSDGTQPVGHCVAITPDGKYIDVKERRYWEPTLDISRIEVVNVKKSCIVQLQRHCGLQKCECECVGFSNEGLCNSFDEAFLDV